MGSRSHNRNLTSEGRRVLKRIQWTNVVLPVLLLTLALPAQDATTLPTSAAMARVTKRVAPEYPVAARQLNIQGTQEIAVTVSESGDVEDAKVLKGNAMFSQSSLAAIKQWKFTPLDKDGSPAKFSSVIVINYTKN